MAHASLTRLLLLALGVIGCCDARNLLGPAPYLQCGGEGGECEEASCKDAAWPDFSCPGNFTCQRFNKWYWQCQEAAEEASEKPEAPLQNYAESDFKQCGGTGNGCQGPKCRDGPWPGEEGECPPGLKCFQSSPFFWGCDVRQPPKSKDPPADVGAKAQSEAAADPETAFQQCGGTSAPRCQVKGQPPCEDAPWVGFSCPPGFACFRSNEFWWGCNTQPVATP